MLASALLPLLACAAPPTGAQAGSAGTMRASLAPDRLGSSAALTLAFRFSGGEEGVPAPVSAMAVRLPAGLRVELTGASTCAAASLRSRGPSGCPRGSLLGRGHALLEVHAGSQTVPEESALSVFRGPNRSGHATVEIFGHGETPLDQTATSIGVLQTDSQPYGLKLNVSVPPIPTLVFEPDASFSTLSVTVGGAATAPGQGRGAILVPRRCPVGGFPFAASFSFADGSSASALAMVPCP